MVQEAPGVMRLAISSVRPEAGSAADVDDRVEPFAPMEANLLLKDAGQAGGVAGVEGLLLV
jgi:hypothetical protein